MTRKRNSTLKLITTLAMVMVLSFSLVIPAVAEPGKTHKHSVGTPDDPAPSAITKIFNMPIGTTTPTASFVFTFQKDGINDDKDSTTKESMPDIKDITITFSSTDVDSIPLKTKVIENQETGVKSVIKESIDIVASNNITKPWPKAGVYHYTVWEDEDKSSVTIPSTVTKADKEFSPAKYTLEFWVEEEEVNNVGTGRLYVKFVNAKTVDGFYDGYYGGKPGDGKVDPTPGEHWQKPYQEILEGYSKVIFTNKYWKSDGGGTEEGDKALEITKVLDGNDTDPNRFTILFEFKITVTQPRLITEPQTYNAYIFDSAGVKVTTGANYDNFGAGGLVTFPSETERTIKLRHGEKLVFTDLHVGAVVVATEKADSRYRPSYERTFANVGGGTKTYLAPTHNMDWGFPRDDEEPLDEGPHYLPEGKNANIVKYINIRTNATPTGLDVDDLPYIILISLAVVGLIGYALIKVRRRTQDGA